MSENAYKCPQCSKLLKSRKVLTLHIRHTHNNSNLHICPECDYKARSPSDLTRYHRIHTGERPEKCDLCDKSFGGVGSLKEHKFHSHGTERPYNCETCGAKFKSLSTKKNHIRSLHKLDVDTRTFACALCSKCYKSSGTLNIHMKHRHTDERPFKCLEVGCDKSFKCKTILRNHMIYKHSTERPHDCEICSLKFKAAAGLRLHYRNGHSEMAARRYECPAPGCDYRAEFKFPLRIHWTRMHGAMDRDVMEQVFVDVETEFQARRTLV